MNPNDKGWLKKYLEFRKNFPPNPNCEKIIESDQSDEKTEEFIYCMLQPTGLMYGYPVNFPNVKHPKIDSWDEKARMKILMTESYISTGSLFFKALESKGSMSDEEYIQLVSQVARFYQEIFPQIEVSKKKSFFGRKKDEIDIAEYVIDKRIDIKQRWDRNFWTSFFQNSLLFLDLYYFMLWMKSDKIALLEDIHAKHDQVRMDILKVIAAAAHANQVIETEERSLFNYFLKSAELPSDKEKLASKYIDDKMTIDDLELGHIDTWLLKKYFLELAILTIWSDQKVEETEKEFIDKLGTKLGFDEKELELSMLAIESFVLQNWENVHYLQEKQDYKIVTERFVKSMSRLGKYYKNSIVQEVRESKELMYLLNKSRSQPLTAEEKEKVRLQLIDVLKTLPFIALVAIPVKILALPVLLKILPKSVLPSAFSEN